jgi:hypothetical protein
MHINDLALLLNVNASANTDTTAPTTTASPSAPTPPADSATHYYEVLAAQVADASNDMRVRKSALRKMVGNLNRTFPLAMHAPNRSSLEQRLIERVRVLGDTMGRFPSVNAELNTTPALREALATPSKIPAYVHKRVEGIVDGRVATHASGHNSLLILRTARILLDAFRIADVERLREACEKMGSLPVCTGSVSARSLLALLVCFLEMDMPAVQEALPAGAPIPQSLGALAYGFYGRALATPAQDTLKTQESGLALLAALQSKMKRNA